MTDFNLEPIIEFQMTEDEITAYKIGLIWMYISTEMFPNYKHSCRFPKKGDPRKSSLFKYCHTLMTKTKGLIDPKDYKLYIAAQLQMLKAIEIGNAHPFIGPWCLVGDKAWTRWKVWKTKYENIGKTKNLKDVGLDKTNFAEVKTGLDQSSKFIKGKWGILTEENYKAAAKDIIRYAGLSKISNFYLALSPWANKYCDLSNIDLSYYHNVGEDSKQYFKDIFPNETSSN
jgi:hypothetical protein